MATRRFTDTPKIGVQIETVLKGRAEKAASSHRLGSQIWANDGRRYVFAQAGATIGAGVTVAAVNPTTFIAAATGGTYTSPPVAMASGDWGWFGAASA